jgi:hypothetical protein
VAEVIRRKKGITAVGNAQVSTAQSQFGSSSALFDGNGDYLVVGNQPDLTLTHTSNWTIECWLRFNSVTGAGVIFNKNQTSSPFAGYRLDIAQNATGKLSFYNGSSFVDFTTSVTTGVWYHVAVVSTAGSIKFYINGTQDATTTTATSNIVNTTQNLVIGSYMLGNFDFLNGYIDEFRISNSARYTANFTPATQPFVNDANTLLLIHADGTNASTFFEDDNGVRAQRGITAVGNAQISTAQSRFGGSSVLFDGNGDNLVVNDYNDLDFGTGDFTVELWARFANTNTSAFLVSGPRQTGSFVLARESDNTIRIGRTNTAWDSTSSGSATTANTWQHIAASRQSGTLRLYVNGTQIFSGANTNSYNFTNFLYIGGIPTDGQWMNGNIDEVRISNVARYTAAFTAPAAPFVNDANTLLLIHADGTNASTVFRDDNGITGKNITAFGNAQISTAQSQFGGSSALFDGNGDYLTSTSESYHLGTGDFTIEGWVRTTATANQGVFHLASTLFPAGTTGIALAIRTDNANWVLYASGGIATSTSVTASTNTWYHYAVVKTGGNTKLYINGVEAASRSDTTNYSNTDDLVIGGYFSTSFLLTGNIDEYRISNTARYTANFTPSTTAFTPDANTLLLLHMDGANASTAFIDSASRSQKGISAFGNAQVSTAQSQFSGASALFDGTGDFLSSPDSYDWELGTSITQWTIEGWFRKSDIGTYRGLISHQTEGGSGIGWGVYISNTNKLTFASSTSDFRFAATSIAANTWYHFAIVRNGASLKMFLNGVEDYSVTNYINRTDSTGVPLLVGRSYNSASGWNGFLEWNGHIDEIRVSNTARYTANFTPATTPFQNDRNTLLLLHMDGTNNSTVFFDDNGQIPFTPT